MRILCGISFVYLTVLVAMGFYLQAAVFAVFALIFLLVFKKTLNTHAQGAIEFFMGILENTQSFPYQSGKDTFEVRYVSFTDAFQKDDDVIWRGILNSSPPPESLSPDEKAKFILEVLYRYRLEYNSKVKNALGAVFAVVPIAPPQSEQ